MARQAQVVWLTVAVICFITLQVTLILTLCKLQELCFLTEEDLLLLEQAALCLHTLEGP